MGCKIVCPGIFVGCLFVAQGLKAEVVIDPPVFTDESIAAGFFGLNSSWGGSWADFDNDGDLDVYTFAHLPVRAPSLSQLWQNNGDGTFTDVTFEKGLEIEPLDKHAAMWSDLDNDGDPDLTIGKGPTQTSFKDEVMENINGLSFVNLPVSAGLDLPSAGRGVTAADFDLDGDLDVLSLGHFLEIQGSNRFFRNNGDMTFTNINSEVGAISEGENNRVAAWSDYDNDGLPDVMLSPPCVLYRNQGDGSFAEVTLAAGILASSECQSPAWGDFDNDGDSDLYVTTGLQALGQIFSGFMYSNNGDGTFTDVTIVSGTANPANARGANWGDYDNDGFLDLYIVNGENEHTDNILFRNNGNGTFTNVAADAGVTVRVEGGGTDGAFTDYNNDGFLDLFVTNGLGTRLGPYVLLKNATNSNNWLKVELEGKRSNRDGLMTKLSLTTDQGFMFREYNGNSHYLSQDSVPVHFGLGQANAVQRLELTWPNGSEQVIENIAPNQILSVVEGRSITRGWPKTKLVSGYAIWFAQSAWNIQWVGGESIRHVFSGTITTDGSIASVTPANFEQNDVVTWDANQIDFIGLSTFGPDTIRFTVEGATTVTFDILQDGVAQAEGIFIGRSGVRPATLPLILQP